MNKFIQANANKVAAELGLIDRDHLLEMISRQTGLGGTDTAFTETISGFNMIHQGTKLPMNRELQGHIFVTRPCCNLTDDNIAAVRELSALYMRTGYGHWLRALRTMLDPISAKNNPTHGSEMFDTRQAFIPFLSNLCITATGWPDRVGNTFAYERGLENETSIFHDTGYKILSQWECSMTLENVVGNPVTKFAEMMLIYQGAVYLNRLMPHLEVLALNEIDYMMRIYRITLAPDGKTISGIAASGASMLSASNIGSMFNYNRDASYNEESKQVTLQFDSVGAMYNDPYLMRAFNRTVSNMDFCPAMGDESTRLKEFIKIEADERPLFNYKCFPWINEKTIELEWWVDLSVYEKLYDNNLNN